MLQSLRAVAVVTVVALAASAGFATNRGVPSGTGDKYTASISSASDVDCYVLELGKGSTLSITAKQYKSTLLPKVTLLAPDGSTVSVALNTKGAGTKSVSVKKVPIDETGVWSVCVAGNPGGLTGDYTVSFKVKAPKALKVKAAGIPSTLESVFEMPANDGALITLKVRERTLPALASVHLEDPAGGTIAPPPETPILKVKTTWNGKKILVNDGLGDYRLVLTGAVSGSTVCDITFTVKLAKHVKVKALLGPEPQVLDIDPSGGRDGVLVTVTASNASNPGVKVFFGDVEATGLTLTPVGSDLEIACPAPLSTESNLGKQVPVFVQNADGQGNTINFQYHGTPGPSTCSPLFAPLAGGNTLTITGTASANRFVPGGDYEVTVGGQAATVLTVLINTITVEAPNLGVPGSTNIIVTDPYGRVGPTVTGPVYVAAPTVDDAEPLSSSFEGGRTITVEGTGFRTGARVYVDGNEANPVTVVNSTTLTFPMPAGPAGDFDFLVTDEFDQDDGVLSAYLSRRGPFTDVTSTAIPVPGVNKVFFTERMAVGDLDGDDRPEILITSRYGTGYGTVFLFQNDGSGVFTDFSAGLPAFSMPGDVGQASTVAIGELDGAPGAEIVMSVRDPFVAPDPFVYYATGPVYTAFSVYNSTGDVNDVILDYATYTSTRVLKNDGNAIFADVTGTVLPDFSTTTMPLVGAGERLQAAGCALGDLDGDAVDDLVLVSRYVFSANIEYSQLYNDLVFGGDAYDVYIQFPDVVTYVPATRVFLNDGSGNLGQASVMPAVSYFADEYTAKEACGADAVALGDVDGDGSNDIVLSLGYPTSYNPVGAAPTYFVTATRILLNDGAGADFTVATGALPTPFGATVAGAGSGEYWQADVVALGDLDDDGDQDIVLGRNAIAYWYDAASAPQLRPAILIFRNDGDGDFTEDTGGFLPSTSYAGHHTNTILGVHSIKIGDLDGDGTADIVVTGHYTGQYDYNDTGYGPFGIIPAGDRPATRLFLNDGSGEFADVSDAWFPTAVNGDYFQSDAVSLGDLDGDGDFELVLGYYTYPYTAYITTGTNPPLRVLSTD